eukprot:gnl/TRDRNA2_/TRDRNA2_178915_c0_seq1.p1 gnl/TRDRNA2_/TRDRNA2_178915_c0~~gnl/TRDRNA2_/TRDRNA2_178915_c0_seq1.p1  ORF type:complete len:621 (-),score=101.13 gnl/TRDRNA2_/TRDRNA2_178915_c0_seq1:94-1956(-)
MPSISYGTARDLVMFLIPLIAAQARSETVTFDLSGYSRFNVNANIDKAALDLVWIIDSSAPPGSNVTVVIDGPPGLEILPALVAGESGTNVEAIAKLKLQCDDDSVSTSAAARSMFKLSAPNFAMLICCAFLCGIDRLRNRSTLSLLLIVVVLVSMLPARELPSVRAEDDLCGGKTVMTLVVQKNQWAGIGGCGYCLEDDMKRSKFFEWRPPCDMAAAAAALDLAAKQCQFDVYDCAGTPLYSLPTTPGEQSKMIATCRSNGWCSGLAEPPRNCSLPATVTSTCLHYHFRESLAAEATEAGARTMENILTCADRMRPVEGRPYTTSGGGLLAPAYVHSQTGDDSWCFPVADTESATSLDIPSNDWTATLTVDAASAWLHHGQQEHASIASFSRFSLDLLRFAAPSALVLAAHAAAADEVRHAKMAFGLAAHFSTDKAATVAIERFPIAIVELSLSLDEFTARTLEEGCIGESAAVARLAYAVEAVHERSPARAVLKELLADEARHAALAWQTVQWAARRGAAVAYADGNESSHSPMGSAPPTLPSLLWAGRVPSTTAAEISAVVNRMWVGPWAQAVVRGDDLLAPLEISRELGAFADAVGKAMRMVSEHLAKSAAAGVTV